MLFVVLSRFSLSCLVPRRINEYQKEHDEASRDIGSYISNPINAYLLTKRLTSDWSIVEQVMSQDLASGK